MQYQMTDYLNNLTPEEKLLLSLCRLEFSDEQKKRTGVLLKEVKDWDHFVDLANGHGIIALCWHNIAVSGNSSSVPAPQSEILHSAYLKSMAHNAFLFNQLGQTADIAKNENIKIVLLKGIVLEKSIYGNIGLRQLSDMDLLLKVEDAILFRKILLKSGYSSMPLISPLHNRLLPYLKSHLPPLFRNGVMTEIHVRLFEEPGKSLTEELIDTAYSIHGTETNLFYPRPHLFFLYLVKHLDRHEKTAHFQIKFYIDLYALLFSFFDQIINKKLFDDALKVNLINAVSEKLMIINRVWGISFPAWVNSYFEKVDPERILEKFTRLLKNPDNNQPDPVSDSLFKPLKEIPGVINKILFITGYIFPSQEYMKYKYGLWTRMKVMLYYPVRWGEIGKRVLRREGV